MKIEINFEESLWYQFALSSRFAIPITVMFDLLKLFFVKDNDMILKHKVEELKRIIDQYAKY